MTDYSAGSIVYDGRNLMLEAGTGIATYTRNAAHVARSNGYRTDALVGSKATIRRGDATLTQVQLYDALAKERPSAAYWAMMAARWVAGAPWGVRPVALKRTPELVDAGVDRLAGFDVVHAAPGVFDVAECHFMRYRRELVAKLDGNASLFHATHATPIRVQNAPNIYTIHDLVPLRLPHATMENKAYWLDLVRRLCRTADHIVTVSEFSRRDIMQLTGMPGHRITNTYQPVGLPEDLLARPEAEVAEELGRCYGLEFGGYFLFVGAIEPKKNLDRLLEAYASSGTKRPLVIAGKLGWQYRETLRAIRNERFLRLVIDGNEVSIRRQVRRLDHVPLSRLVSLYRGARAFLFPSIYEGFGLPVIEAMLAGAPVMTANSTSLAEIAGDAALLVDPYDVDAMARGIRALDNDEGLRREYINKGHLRSRQFSHAVTGERLAQVYSKLV